MARLRAALNFPPGIRVSAPESPSQLPVAGNDLPPRVRFQRGRRSQRICQPDRAPGGGTDGFPAGTAGAARDHHSRDRRYRGRRRRRGRGFRLELPRHRRAHPECLRRAAHGRDPGDLRRSPPECRRHRAPTPRRDPVSPAGARGITALLVAPPGQSPRRRFPSPPSSATTGPSPPTRRRDWPATIPCGGRCSRVSTAC